MTTTPAKGGSSKALMNQIGWGLQNGSNSSFGAMMGFMGIPWSQKRGGQWMTMDPRSQSIYPVGSSPPPTQPPGDPTTGGDDPATDDDKNNQEMIKAGLPPWWVDWLNTKGKYGGVPPTPGLLG